MNIADTRGRGWPINDIGGLARHVPEVDPNQYFDEQARLAYEEALVKWPVLARLMGLTGEAGGPGLNELPAGPRDVPLPSPSTR